MQINIYLLSVFCCISFSCTPLKSHLGTLPFLGEVAQNNYCQARELYNIIIIIIFFLNGPSSFILDLTLYTQALQEYEELVSRPADDSNLALGKDVLDTRDFDAMEEYCITDLPGGEVLPRVLSEKGMQTVRLNIVEEEIQTQ